MVWGNRTLAVSCFRNFERRLRIWRLNNKFKINCDFPPSSKSACRALEENMMALSAIALPSFLRSTATQLSFAQYATKPRNPSLFSPQSYTRFLLIPLIAPLSVCLNVPSLISDIWESILRAVPKKKTSHMKRRHRFMAGKALKDVHSLNKCSACGNVKRAHLLCPYCVRGMLYGLLG